MVVLKPEHKRWIVWILRGAFLVYLFCLMYLMFLSERYGRAGGLGMYRYNLVPFQEIRRYFLHREQLSFETFFINIYGNVLAFLPFGFLLPVISGKDRRFWSVFLLSVALTLTLETAQLILQVGCFDVDDMILNTAGGVLGYWIYRLLLCLFRNIERAGKPVGRRKQAFQKKEPEGRNRDGLEASEKKTGESGGSVYR